MAPLKVLKISSRRVSSSVVIDERSWRATRSRFDNDETEPTAVVTAFVISEMAPVIALVADEFCAAVDSELTVAKVLSRERISITLAPLLRLQARTRHTDAGSRLLDGCSEAL